MFPHTNQSVDYSASQGLVPGRTLNQTDCSKVQCPFLVAGHCQYLTTGCPYSHKSVLCEWLSHTGFCKFNEETCRFSHQIPGTLPLPPGTMVSKQESGERREARNRNQSTNRGRTWNRTRGSNLTSHKSTLRNQGQNRDQQGSSTLQPPFEPKSLRYRNTVECEREEEFCVLPQSNDEAVLKSPASRGECTITRTSVGYDVGGRPYLSASPIRKLFINFNRYEWSFLQTLLSLDIGSNLGSIDLWNASNLTDDQCIALSKPTLVAVGLINATKVSDAAFMAFVLNCKGLEYFEITGKLITFYCSHHFGTQNNSHSSCVKIGTTQKPGLITTRPLNILENSPEIASSLKELVLHDQGVKAEAGMALSRARPNLNVVIGSNTGPGLWKETVVVNTYWWRSGKLFTVNDCMVSDAAGAGVA